MSFAESTGQEKQPYKYNNKEFDSMAELNWYDYVARMLTMDIPGFTSQDPKSENSYSESPYVYVSNNPLKYIDPDGREKLNGMGPREGGDRLANYRYNTDNHMIHIYAHGSTNGIQYIDKQGGITEIRNTQQLKDFLTRYSAIYNNRTENEELIVVLHACYTASAPDSEKLPFAQNLSMDMSNMVFIAPEGEITLTARDETVSVDVRYLGRKVQSVRNWVIFKDGMVVNAMPGNAENNPDLLNYHRPSWTKGNTKKEQEIQNQKGMNKKKEEDYRNSFRGRIRTKFYETFGF